MKRYTNKAAAIKFANTFTAARVVVFKPSTSEYYDDAYLVGTPDQAAELDPQYHTVIYRNVAAQ